MGDLRLITIIGTAHFVSHFFQLALPPLFPVLREEFGVGYVGLGLVTSIYYGVSGIGQAVAGFLVDRFGARRLLLGGTALIAVATGLAGLARSFPMLIGVAVLAALGNAVFHPADYAIYNAAVARARLGRAYSAHGIGGSLGYAAGPAAIVALASVLGWRGALGAAAVGGLGWTLLLAHETRGVADHPRGPVSRALVRGADLRLLFSAPILAGFAYFAFLATATTGMQTFAVAAAVSLYAVPLGLATGALTAYLVGKAAGVLAGGFLTDRTDRHDLIAAVGMLAAAALVLVVASGGTPFPVVTVALVLAGLAIGVAQPARDMLVRAATPPGASGKVFGFAYSGLDLGSAVTPLMFGWLLDHGHPRALFAGIAGFMLLTIGTVIEVRRRAAAPAQ